MSKKLKWLITGSICLLISLATVGADEKVVNESWYATYIMGNKLGWHHELVVEKQIDGQICYQSTTHTELRINRLGQIIPLVEKSTVIEDGNGKLISFEYYQKQSARATTIEGKVNGDEIHWSVQSGGAKSMAQKHPYDSSQLCPYALQKYMEKQGTAPGTSYDVKIFMAQVPNEAPTMQVKVVGVERLEILKQKRQLIRVNTQIKMRGMTVFSEIWISEDWMLWKIKSMGMIEFCKMPRELAQKPGKIEDIFISSIIPTNKKIVRARAARFLRFKLIAMPGCKIDFKKFPAGERQRIIESGKDFIKIEVKAVSLDKATPKTPLLGDACLRSTMFLQKDDTSIQALAKKIASGVTDPLVIAKKMEKWVCDNLQKKNFGVGFATAAEVAANMEGDCSEHAVLLAALCRAAGIPSRVVAGVVYAEGIKGFGFHMWVEVHVGQWYALDPTLGHGFADATHIAMAKSALESEGAMFDLVPIALYLGKLRIEVVD